MKYVIKVCNCSECHVEIETAYADGRLIGEAVYRKDGRPLCERCSWVPVPTWSKAAIAEDDGSPWHENCVRALEDNR